MTEIERYRNELEKAKKNDSLCKSCDRKSCQGCWTEIRLKYEINRRLNPPRIRKDSRHILF